MKKDKIKIAYSDDYSGFILSPEAIAWMKGNGYSGKFATPGGDCAVPRHDPVLVSCIETLGQATAGTLKFRKAVIGTSVLRIAEIDGPLYYIVNYDGKETVIGVKDLIDTSARGDSLFIESFPEDKVFFTADTHFGHSSIIYYSSRPFESAGQMDAEIIRLWNETVPPDGVVFHLGDFAYGPASRWNEILRQLNGSIHLVTGNHDRRNARKKALENFSSVRDQRMIEVGGQKIYLNHYPFLCYGGAYDGVWQLFGHVHSGPRSRSGLDHPRLRMLYPGQYDVGVDNNGFRPISFAEVRAIIESQIARAESKQKQ